LVKRDVVDLFIVLVTGRMKTESILTEKLDKQYNTFLICLCGLGVAGQMKKLDKLCRLYSFIPRHVQRYSRFIPTVFTARGRHERTT
jgi:hypothetical protein